MTVSFYEGNLTKQSAVYYNPEHMLRLLQVKYIRVCVHCINQVLIYVFNTCVDCYHNNEMVSMLLYIKRQCQPYT